MSWTDQFEEPVGDDEQFLPINVTRMAYATLLATLAGPLLFAFSGEITPIIGALGYRDRPIPIFSISSRLYERFISCSDVRSIFDAIPCKNQRTVEFNIHLSALRIGDMDIDNHVFR